MSNYRKPKNEEKVMVADGMTVGLPIGAKAWVCYKDTCYGRVLRIATVIEKEGFGNVFDNGYENPICGIEWYAIAEEEEQGRMNNLETVISILGSDNIDKIRKELTELIIDDLRQSVKYEWFVLPSEWNDMFENICTEVFDEMKKKYKKELKTLAKANFEKWIAEQLKENEND